MIERKEYLEQLQGLKDKQIIKVITGIRRCGKSTLLTMFQDQLRSDGVLSNQIVSINFEDFDFADLKEPEALHSYVKNHLVPDKMTYVFLDEIQNVRDFPIVVESLFIKKNVDLYITGSNAYMLSDEIATLLSGRYIEIRMLPLSFKEYIAYTGSTNELSRKYADYLRESSFPYTTELGSDQKKIHDYLNGIYSTVVLKDVVGRHRIADSMMLESVIRFLFDNIGNPLSTKKISDTMTSDGRKIDTKTVERYIEALMESFIIYQAKRYDVKGKQYLKTLEKYYVVDLGMRRMLLRDRGTDVGHMLENIIYLELLRRRYQVYIGKLEDTEVDFVAMNEKGFTYFQVAATVREETTLTRELRPLQKIPDNYPKYILTLDDDPIADYGGIRRMNALDFLMSEIS
ncbi:MAG: ATP-binding protein [Flexilinea sp.]